MYLSLHHRGLDNEKLFSLQICTKDFISDMQVTPEVALDAVIAKLSIRKTKNIANIYAFDIW